MEIVQIIGYRPVLETVLGITSSLFLLNMPASVPCENVYFGVCKQKRIVSWDDLFKM